MQRGQHEFSESKAAVLGPRLELLCISGQNADGMTRELFLTFMIKISIYCLIDLSPFCLLYGGLLLPLAPLLACDT